MIIEGGRPLIRVLPVSRWARWASYGCETMTTAPERAAAAPETQTEFFVARQPILTRDSDVFAYELLFRSGPENIFTAAEGTQATAELITGRVLTMGLDQLSASQPAFINFTRNLLVNDYFTLLPPEQTVVELLEDIEIDGEVVDTCRRLRSGGYRLALDDVTSLEKYEPILDLVNFVKVDFERASEVEREALARARGSRRTRIWALAEKVETQTQFHQALELGYDYFQGHFLSRTAMLSGKEIPAFKLSLMELLYAAHRPEFDFGELEAIVKRDLSLSYKMLRFANAAAHGVRHRIESVKHALVMLGQADVVRAVSLLALAGMAADRPEELSVRSVIRANMCEALAPRAGLGSSKLDLFLLGMFSMVDVLLDMPMEELVTRLPTSEEVNDPLLTRPGRLRDVLELVISYEDAHWPRVAALSERLRVQPAEVPALYVDAVTQADDVYSGPEG